MKSKQIYCNYCGRIILTLAFTVEKDAHLHHLTFIVVCDKCAKSTEIKFDNLDLVDNKNGQ